MTSISGHHISIAICTRERWSELEVTLELLRGIGLGELPLIVGDDASEALCPIDLSLWPGGCRLLRSETRIGLVAQRNKLIQESTTDYTLIIDDDSAPCSADFGRALALLEQSAVAVVGFPVRFPNGSWQVPPSATGRQMRSFIGCGHLMKREAFLAAGGYRAELIHQGEEIDLSARLFAVGLKCVHCAEPVFEHRLVQVARSYERMDRFGTRNELLFIDWYAPRSFWGLRIFRSLVKRVCYFVRVRRLSILRGIIDWLVVRSSLRNRAQPMLRAQWRAFLELPQ